MNPQTEDKLKRALRDRQPAYIAAKCSDEEKLVELVPGKDKRAKWLPMLRGLDGLSWLWVELRDVKGRMIGERLKNDEAPAEEEALSMGSEQTNAAAGAALIPAAAVGQLFLLSSRHAENLIDKNTAASKPAWDLMHKTAEHATGLLDTYKAELEQERMKRLKAEADRDKLVDTVAKLVEAKQSGDEEGWKNTLTNIVKTIPHIPAIFGVLRQFGLLPTPKVAAPAAAAGPKAA